MRQNIDSSDIHKISSQKGYHKPNKKDPTADSIPLNRPDETEHYPFPKRKRNVEKQQPKFSGVNK